MTEPVGTLCIVLHTHLPWVAHAGAWPVGEEWLHQAWAASYSPVVALLDELASEGRRDVLTLGMTPVLHAMLDDPYCLSEHHTWLGTWLARAASLAARPGASPALRDVAAYEWRLATQALQRFERSWRHGTSPVLRGLADNGVVELLGGPASHPFQPLLDERLVTFGLDVGLADHALRLGRPPGGIWAPECAYRAGLETAYARAGVTHFLCDGPTLIRSAGNLATAAAHRVGDSDVVVFGRDLDVTYRVWSPRSGYPGGRWYRDFHTFDHDSGIRPARVTSRRTEPEDKQPYDPGHARGAVVSDAADFVRVVRQRLELLARATGRPGLVVVAYDTELFGHWWHEGPQWLGAVIRALPEAGVRVTTLRGAVDAGHVEGRVDLQPGSWGSGKDWRVWESPLVADLVADHAEVQRRLLALADKRWRASHPPARDSEFDQAAREALLTLASDWTFCVSKDSAAAYARSRHAAHRDRFHALADALESRHEPRARRLAQQQRALDGPFGHLDSRRL